MRRSDIIAGGAGVIKLVNSRFLEARKEFNPMKIMRAIALVLLVAALAVGWSCAQDGDNEVTPAEQVETAVVQSDEDISIPADTENATEEEEQQSAKPNTAPKTTPPPVLQKPGPSPQEDPAAMERRGRVGGVPSRRPTEIIIGTEPQPDDTKISGRVLIVAKIPPETKSVATFYCDDQSIAAVHAAPYRMLWDSSAVPNGSHVLRVVAVNEKKEQVWEGKVLVTVDNKGRVEGPEPARSGVGMPPLPATGPALDSAGSRGESSAPWKLVWTSQHKVSFSYPGDWKMADHTQQMVPKWQDGFWYVFTPTDPDLKMTINLRHRRLDNPSTPENYVKYNPYLAEWRRVEINSKPAFRTTQGSVESKRVVHRMLIVDGARIWMLNCIDETGGDLSRSEKVLMDLVESLSGSAPSKGAIE